MVLLILLRPLILVLLKCEQPQQNQQNRRVHRQLYQKQQQQYNPYNLYLLYMTLPDLIYNALTMWRCSIAFTGHAIKPKYWLSPFAKIIHFKDWESLYNSIMMICNTANLCMNLVIVFEIFKLLKNSYELNMGYTPPSLLRASLQAVFIYVISITWSFFTITFPFWIRSDSTIFVINAVCVLVTYFVPFIFILWIYVLIWKCNYLDTLTNINVKSLAINFLKIVIVFIIFWIPIAITLIIFMFCSVLVNDGTKLNMAFIQIMMSLQAIS